MRVIFGDGSLAIAKHKHLLTNEHYRDRLRFLGFYMQVVPALTLSFTEGQKLFVIFSPVGVGGDY